MIARHQSHENDLAPSDAEAEGAWFLSRTLPGGRSPTGASGTGGRPLQRFGSRESIQLRINQSSTIMQPTTGRGE